MYKLRRSAAAKVTTVLLMLLTSVLLVASAMSAGVYLSSEHKSAALFYLENFTDRSLWELVSAMEYEFESELPEKAPSWSLPAHMTEREYTNHRYEIKKCTRENPEGDVLLNTIDESEPLQGTMYFAIVEADGENYYMSYMTAGCYTEQELQRAISHEEKKEWYMLRISLPAVLTADDWSGPALAALQVVFRMGSAFLPIAACCSALLLAGFAFLIYAAGYRGQKESAVCGRYWDRIPFDLLVIVWGCAGLMALVLGFDLLDELWLYPALAALAFWLLLPLLLTLIVRLRTGTLFSGMLTVRIVKALGRRVSAGLRGLFRVLPSSLRLLSFWLLMCAAQLLLLLLLLAHDERDLIFLAAVIFDLLLLAGLLYLWESFRRVSRAACAVGAGDTKVVIKKTGMLPVFRSHAENIEHIADGLSRAVEEKLRSERMKTELITNVSHDIKTPLTSIVNYVDLLSRGDLPDEVSREYIEVLSRQSARLKKLIEDLIEVSKASSGSLKLHKEPCNLQVLLGQVCGEYEEKYQQTGLQPVLRISQEPCVILADGRYMWRILDNVLGNARKYAQPGTRVYISLEKMGDSAVIACKNISREELNIRAEELLERFVRGDGSRHTEGSGLGLSIASSLTQLQGGEMNISIDGDLFKVILRFPLEEA